MTLITKVERLKRRAWTLSGGDIDAAVRVCGCADQGLSFFADSGAGERVWVWTPATTTPPTPQ